MSLCSTSSADIWSKDTISLSIEVSPLRQFRRAVDDDISEIKTIVTDNYFNLFGPISIEFKIKKCHFSMVALNEDNRIVAVICLDDHPNIPVLPKSEWETWITNLYSLHNMTSQNTFWIHLIACHAAYSYTFLKPLLKQVFLTFPYLIHLVVVVPGNTACFPFLEENFTCIMPTGYTNPKKVQTLYLTLRHHYTTKYKIRLAVEEDNDDIVSIIDTHSTRLREMYGEYYVSEILTKFSDMKRKIIVAEISERAVGVLFLNEDVNYDTLINAFHLEPFANLHTLDKNKMIILKRNVTQPVTTERPCYEGEIKYHVHEVECESRQYDDGEDDTIEVNFDEEFSITDIIDLEKLGILQDGQLIQETSTEPQSYYETIPEDDPENYNTGSFRMSEGEYPVQSHSLIEFELPMKDKTAFSLEVMASAQEHEKGVLCDLLEASFQSFATADKQYCVFSVQNDISHFPLFDYFVRAIPRRLSLYPRELYLLHRNSIKAVLEVRKMSKSEFNQVKELVNNISYGTALIDSVTRSLYGTESSQLKTYIIRNGSVIIGLMIVRVLSNPKEYFDEFTCGNYVDMQAHRYDRYGLIKYCVISPIFQKHVQYFLREVHRISDMSILFFKMRKLQFFEKSRTKPLPGILKDMIPVIEKLNPNFKCMHLEHDIIIPESMQGIKKDPCSLFISTTKLCSIPRIEINSRIVVVGASCTSYAFLESLVFNYEGTKHINFNNVYLIYDRAIKDSFSVSKYTPHMFPLRGKYSGNHVNSMYFNTHVNYVHGFMTAINRKFKYITVNKNKILPYDYLFLFCGQQFHHPYATGIRRDKICEPCPANVFVVNKFSDAEEAFAKINASLRHRYKPVVIVYGACFYTYGCLTALQKSHGKEIAIKLVEPIPDEYERPSMDPFNNPDIYDAFNDVLFLAGIEVYTGYYFYEWDVENNMVQQVKYQSRKGSISFNCDFIFHYANREVNDDTFSALNNAGLVYDGKLVIGPDCRTNDPYIFAAGPMTKYSRRYFADRFLHKYYSSNELGTRLGKHIRAILLPGGLECNEGDPIFNILNQKDTNKLVPQYTEPVLMHCVLPSGIQYLDIHSPGKPVPMETRRNIGCVFETGNLKKIEPDEDPEYFRIQFDQNYKVEQVVCFTRKETDLSNFQKLWGKHEKSLNNLIRRFQKGMITNFYDYFQSPYFCAIYSVTFSELQNKLESILTLLTNEKGTSIIEDIVKTLITNNWRKLNVVQDEKVRRKFLCSQYHDQMVDEIMRYLGHYSDYLPMYAHPLITKLILYDVETSPLFKKPENLSQLQFENV